MADHIRRYRISYRVPPLHAPDEHGSRVRLYGPSGEKLDDHWWDEIETLDAFDMEEAIQRLQYRLLAKGYRRPGLPHVPVYELVDIAPQRAVQPTASAETLVRPLRGESPLASAAWPISEVDD